MDPTVTLPPSLQGALEAGHPWVYRDHVGPGVRHASGTWVRVRAGRAERWALWDAEGAIALRVVRAGRRPDRAWFEERVRQAWALREPLRRDGVTAFRWVNGEGDGLPGLVVDRYGDHAVVMAYTQGVAAHLPEVLHALDAVAPPRGVLERRPGAREKERIVGWHGEAAPPGLIVEVHGARLSVDLVAGQKSGLFLDHRENRRWLGPLARGANVLELFCYTGAFGVQAALHGAARLVQVDRSAVALAAAEQNLRLNGLEALPREAHAADVVAWLGEARRAGRRFDLVVSDPPSFARQREQRGGAERAYERLHRAVLGVVAPGGLAAFASCTAQVSPEAFRRTVAAAASRAGRSAQLVHEAGHGLDHPVLLEHPEGRYLKFLVVRVM